MHSLSSVFAVFDYLDGESLRCIRASLSRVIARDVYLAGEISRVPNSGRVFKGRSRQTSHREDKREEAIVERVG